MNNLLKRAIISYRELELAIEFLLFIVKIIVFERVFFRKLFNAIRRSMTIIRITSDIKIDLL